MDNAFQLYLVHYYMLISTPYFGKFPKKQLFQNCK